VAEERDEEVGRGDERRERGGRGGGREQERGRQEREREEEREVVGSEVRAGGERGVGEAEAVELRGGGVERVLVLGGAALGGTLGGAGVGARRAEDGARGVGGDGVRVDVGVEGVEEEGGEVEEVGGDGERERRGRVEERRRDRDGEGQGHGHRRRPELVGGWITGSD